MPAFGLPEVNAGRISRILGYIHKTFTGDMAIKMRTIRRDMRLLAILAMMKFAMAMMR